MKDNELHWNLDYLSPCLPSAHVNNQNTDNGSYVCFPSFQILQTIQIQIFPNSIQTEIDFANAVTENLISDHFLITLRGKQQC